MIVGSLVMVDFVAGELLALVLSPQKTLSGIPNDRFNLKIASGLYAGSTCNRHISDMTMLSSG
jgi:hypothetical protein